VTAGQPGFASSDRQHPQDQWTLEAEGHLRELLPADDPLHPDNYHGPYGGMWGQSVAYILRQHKRMGYQ
jgi:hypothetical protein